MEVLPAPGSCTPPAGGSVVTIGAYDGVHLGHCALIAEVCRRAAQRDLASVVVTFDRHPATVVRPDTAPRLLTDLPQKLELLAATGIDHAMVVPFDLARSQEPAEHFVEEILVRSLGARIVIVGEDFHFGHGRRGNVDLLADMGGAHNFVVEGFGLVGVDGIIGKVSSTAIRGMLGDGDVKGAAHMLGRPYEVRGVVREGDRRGREWGFPTANVAVPDEVQLPADGIYAGWYIRHGGASHPAAISLGRRPTVKDHQDHSLLEAHLLDFDGDLYGEPARVQFVERLRAEERFDTVDALVVQIGRDVEATRAALA